jgi:hypothetical protein
MHVPEQSTGTNHMQDFPTVPAHQFYKSWLLYILIRVNSKFHNISGCALLGPW